MYRELAVNSWILPVAGMFVLSIIDLIPVLMEIIVWSEKYHDVHPNAVKFVK
jgi:hypothetical protein